MKKIIIIISITILTVIGIVSTIHFLFLPIECILNDKQGCIQKASESDINRLQKIACKILGEEDCIALLGLLHSSSKDLLIPSISDEYCENNKAVFCAFSSIGYSNSGDIKNATHYASKGCEMNEGVSCAILAGLQLDKEDMENALMSALKGCTIGSAAACAICGAILLEKGEEQDGIKFINRCCELGGEECCE